MVADIARLDLLDDQRLDCFLDLLPVAKIEHWLDHALTGGVLRADPARAGIPIISKGVEIGLRSRWCRVEGAVSVKLHARNEEVQLHVAHVLVSHPENIRLIPLKPRKGGFLEICHHSRLICFRGIVVRMEGHDTAGIAPLPGVAVDQDAGQVRVARQHLWRHIPPNGLARDALAVFGIGRDLLREQVVHRRPTRTVPMGKEAHHHLECSATISASWRSSAIRRVRTAIRSMERPALRSTLMARAIWFKLLPARPTAASRTGSTSGGRARRCIGSADKTQRAYSDRERS